VTWRRVDWINQILTIIIFLQDAATKTVFSGGVAELEAIASKIITEYFLLEKKQQKRS
jgi:hypothetical protein